MEWDSKGHDGIRKMSVNLKILDDSNKENLRRKEIKSTKRQTLMDC